MTDEEIHKLSGFMKKESFEIGQPIIRYGDPGAKYYVLSKGRIKVTVYQMGTDESDPDINSKIAVTKVLESGIGFGELALLYNAKRSATIECLEPCETFALDGAIFKSLIVKSSLEKRSKKALALDRIKLFGKCYSFSQTIIFSNLLFHNRPVGQIPETQARRRPVQGNEVQG